MGAGQASSTVSCAWHAGLRGASDECWVLQDFGNQAANDHWADVGVRMVWAQQSLGSVHDFHDSGIGHKGHWPDLPPGTRGNGMLCNNIDFPTGKIARHR